MYAKMMVLRTDSLFFYLAAILFLTKFLYKRRQKQVLMYTVGSLGLLVLSEPVFPWLQHSCIVTLSQLWRHVGLSENAK